ncbi:MAG: hypothetical protein GF417_05625 [Candidatus Latescibacteria bacterium]|nr:hypothetical protein [bacterium]MBD3423895.1 hypothetical protein [Candidatus Latescibacterota bacterium]
MRIYRFLIMAFMLATAAVPADKGRCAVYLDGEEVVFSHSAPRGSKVFLVGDFNGWNPTIDRMIWEDGSYRVRLFLLPNRYSYRFVVDGERMVDRDNRSLDSEGNSVFYFVEEDGVYSLHFSRPGGGDGKDLFDGAEYGLEGLGYGEEGSGEVLLSGSFRGELSEDLVWSATAACSDEEEPFILKAEAVSGNDDWRVRGFYRAGGLDLGDPLHLIGPGGPYDYLPGLFCRGIGVEKSREGVLSGRIFIAERLEGYRNGLEEVKLEPGAESEELLTERDPAGNDIIGLKVGLRLGRADLRYLFRRNRGISSAVSGAAGEIQGTEEVRVNGVWAEYQAGEGNILELQYLYGSSSLCDYDLSGDVGVGNIQEEIELQSGWKLYAGFTTELAGFDCGLSIIREKLTNYPSGATGDKDKFRNAASLKVGAGSGNYQFGLKMSAESYTGSIAADFLLRRRNFWLDGDRVRYYNLPLINSGGMLELHSFLTRGESLPGGPFGSDRLSIVFAADMDRLSRSSVVLRAVKSIHLRFLLPDDTPEPLREIDLMADLRGVIYNYPGIEEGYTDLFVGLRKEFDRYAWVIVGLGFNPYRIDRWEYDINRLGREIYMDEKGVFSSAASLSPHLIAEALKDAEGDLSGNYTFSVQAGFRF